MEGRESGEGSEERKVDRVLANHSLSSTASQGRSNIPLSFFPALGIRPPGVEGTKEINIICLLGPSTRSHLQDALLRVLILRWKHSV